MMRLYRELHPTCDSLGVFRGAQGVLTRGGMKRYKDKMLFLDKGLLSGDLLNIGWLSSEVLDLRLVLKLVERRAALCTRRTRTKHPQLFLEGTQTYFASLFALCLGL
jgi:hypothetical protein